MKLQKFTTAFLALILFSMPYFAQVNVQVSNSAAPPQYQIFDIGVVQTGDSASQGLGASAGGIGLGRSIRTGGSQAFFWTNGGTIAGLPNLSGSTYCLSVGANDTGSIAGTCATSLNGTNRLPVVWDNGAVSQLTLPAGQTLGDANDINASKVTVGSVGSGSAQRGVIYSSGTGTIITQTTSNGSFFTTAFRINNAGRIVGQGIDPANAARNVGMVYDIGSGSAFEVGALPNANGALAFDVSNTGFVVGSSMQNQGSGRPFIWSQAGGIVEIPLPVGTSQGSARSVNANGLAVGTASSSFAIPFLYDGTNTYRLGDLIPANSGWDLLTNTSSSALGISDGGIIVGTGVLNGQIRAYAMVPATNAVNKTAFDFDGDGRSDISVFRGGTWFLNRSTAGFSGQNFGTATDRLAPADYDGDGKTDLAVWRGTSEFANFYILQSSNGAFRAVQFGSQGDVPLPGDWDNDGLADLAVYRDGSQTGGQSYFYYRPSGTTGVNFVPVAWGATDDKSVVGDFDGDGRRDAAVFRPSAGAWFIRQSSNNTFQTVSFGAATDVLVPADYDGDRKTDVAVFRGGTWYTQGSVSGFRAVTFGSVTDTPVPADYDGDGKANIAVFRNGNRFSLNSANTQFQSVAYGQTNDRTVPAAFLP